MNRSLSPNIRSWGINALGDVRQALLGHFHFGLAGNVNRADHVKSYAVAGTVLNAPRRLYVYQLSETVRRVGDACKGSQNYSAD